MGHSLGTFIVAYNETTFEKCVVSMTQIVVACNLFIYRYIMFILQREQTWFISSLARCLRS